jgi:hypothetical protein
MSAIRPSCRASSSATPTASFGSTPSYNVTAAINWDTPFPEWSWIIQSTSPARYHQTSYCLSRIRHDRLAGQYTFWSDQEWYDSTEYFPPFTVTIIFDAQSSTIPGSFSSGPDWGSSGSSYLYGSCTSDVGCARDLGRSYTGYSDAVSQDELWGEAAKPGAEEEE